MVNGNSGFGEDNKKLVFKNIIYEDIDLCLLFDKYKKVGSELDIVEENYFTKDFYTSCFYLDKQEEIEKTLRELESQLENTDKGTSAELRSKIRKEINRLEETLEFYKSL